MYKAFKFRMYLNVDQQVLVNKSLGCTRFVFNYYLSLKQKEYEETKRSKSALDCIKDLPRLIRENSWLKEADSMSLRCALFDLDNAFQKMFKEKSGYPKFKKKEGKNSYRTNYIKSEYKGKKYVEIMEREIGNL